VNEQKACRGHEPRTAGPGGCARLRGTAPAKIPAETIMTKTRLQAAQMITARWHKHEPKGPLLGGRSEEARRRPWRRHFGIAARAAAGAFDTPENARWRAAEAIARCDFIACPHREAGEE
jgi:hypothetical protein